MARERDMHGKKIETKPVKTVSDEMFDDVLKDLESKKNQKDQNEQIEKDIVPKKEDTPEPTTLDIQDELIRSIAEELESSKVNVDKLFQKTATETQVKGGKLSLSTTPLKMKKVNFLKLNKNNQYELQKKDPINEKTYLRPVKKTWIMRPDVLEIAVQFLKSEEGEVIRGRQQRFINNAMILELVRLGALGEEALDQIEDV